MTVIDIGAASPDDIEALASKIRPEDVAEIRAASGLAPDVGLKRSFALSTHVWAARHRREGVIAVWGVGPLSLAAGRGCPWLLASPALDRFGRQIVGLSHPLLARMRAAYPDLENHIDARNRRAVRWLEWLGFVVEPPAPWGAEGLPFHRFWM